MGREYAFMPITLRPADVRRTYRGGDNIKRWRRGPAAGGCPEDWVCSVTPAQNSGFPPVPGEGLSFLKDDQTVSLRHIVNDDPKGLLGDAHHQAYGQSLALLVKLIDSAERLSIQVHPDQAFAKHYLGSQFGKTEAWYILATAPVNAVSPYLLLGFKQGVTREIWSRLFWEQRIPEMVACLNRVTPSPGDVFLVPPGTPHAIGPGCFLIEAQEPTDFTFRAEWSTPDGTRINDELIHYGLGLEKVIDCFDFDAAAKQRPNNAIQPRVVCSGSDGTETTLLNSVDTDRFAMEEIRVQTTMNCTSRGQFSSLIVLSGSGAIEWDDGSLMCRPGDRFFLPYGLQQFALVNGETDGELRLVRCFPPLA